MFLPAIRFTYQFATREYGLLPMALGNMTYWSGVWATVILLAALAVTPALTILRWPALVDVRVRGASSTLSRVSAGDIVAVLDLRGARPGRRLFQLSPEQVRG